MPTIHQSAALDGNITLADDVVIGPNCVLQGDILIGAGTRLVGNVYLTGKLSMGQRNVVYPFSCIGFAAQDVNYSNNIYEPGIFVGNDNTFREGCTVHRATQELPTTIGDNNYFMTTAHVGHDCQIENHVTMVTNSCLGGHVHVQDRVIIGGMGGAHQFTKIGKGAMIAGGFISTYDVLPYFMLTGNNIVGSINVIGMRRSGMDNEERTRRKEIFKLLYRSGQSLGKAIDKLKTQKDAIAQEYVDAINNSKRGIVPLCTENRMARRGSLVREES
jgi:UDP-N-acetylglucosamine acyltransferase